jgi:hypothetical protein
MPPASPPPPPQLAVEEIEQEIDAVPLGHTRFSWSSLASIPIGHTRFSWTASKCSSSRAGAALPLMPRGQPAGTSGAAEGGQVSSGSGAVTATDKAPKGPAANAAKTKPAVSNEGGERPAAADASAHDERAAKRMKAAVKEGGKKGVELAGCADMGGLEFFTTQIEKAEGDLVLLKAAMDAGGRVCVCCGGAGCGLGRARSRAQLWNDFDR